MCLEAVAYSWLVDCLIGVLGNTDTCSRSATFWVPEWVEGVVVLAEWGGHRGLELEAGSACISLYSSGRTHSSGVSFLDLEGNDEHVDNADSHGDQANPEEGKLRFQLPAGLLEDLLDDI